MVFLRSSLPGLAKFLQPISRNGDSLGLIVAWIAAFLLHPGRMGAVRAANAVRTEPRHRAQLTRFLRRRFWQRTEPLSEARNALLRGMAIAGRVVFCLDQTMVSQAGEKTPNTYSTGNRKRRPQKRRRYSKYTHAKRQCHCHVMGLLIFPDGTRVPFSKSYYTKQYCQLKGLTYRTQTTIAAELIAELPLPAGTELLVLGDTAFDAAVIRAACEPWRAHWIVPLNPERVLAGPAPRPKVRSLFPTLPVEDFVTVRLIPGKGPTTPYRRVCPGRDRSGKKQPRTFYVQGVRRQVRHVGEALLVFSTRQAPQAGAAVEVSKILMTNAVGWTARAVVEWYDVRWQIELFFKELKSGLGFAQYRLRDYDAVEAWVQLALLAFLYLEWYRRQQLARRDLPDEQRQRWERWRTHGVIQMVRHAAERVDLETLAQRARTPHGIRRLKTELKQALPKEYRAA